MTGLRLKCLGKIQRQSITEKEKQMQKVCVGRSGTKGQSGWSTVSKMGKEVRDQSETRINLFHTFQKDKYIVNP